MTMRAERVLIMFLIAVFTFHGPLYARFRPQPKHLNLPFDDQTFIAYSTDGLSWEAESEPAFERASVPDVVHLSNGNYLLYWVDFSKVKDFNDVEHLSCAVSKSGKNWSRPVEVKIEGMSGVKAVDPSAVELEGGWVRLYYFSPTRSDIHAIRSAVSNDGGWRFDEEPGVRFEAKSITDPDVIQRPDGTWLMYLSRGQNTLIAYSNDGLIFKDTGVTLKEGGVPGAMVLENGQIRLFVTGPEGITSLISPDGIRFTPEEGIRIGRQKTTRLVADPSACRMGDGRWIMAFKQRP